MEEAEDLLCEAGDIIDNAAFDLLNTMSPERIDRDMSVVAEVADAAERIMELRGLKTCRPWLDADEVVCYKSEDRCKYCTR